MANCVRCEIARAKLFAILCHNVGDSARTIAEKLNARYSGSYSVMATDEGELVQRSPENGKPHYVSIFLKKRH